MKYITKALRNQITDLLADPNYKNMIEVANYSTEISQLIVVLTNANKDPQLVAELTELALEIPDAMFKAVQLAGGR